MIKCPNCGNSVSKDATRNLYESKTEDAFFYEVWGVCRQCGKAFSWKEKYTHVYLGSENIKEDTEY